MPSVVVNATLLILFLLLPMTAAGAQASADSQSVRTLNLHSYEGAITARLIVPERITPFSTFTIHVVLECERESLCHEPHVRFNARMPGHGHGMNYAVSVTRESDTRFRVEGVRLHMPGTWDLHLDVQPAHGRNEIYRLQAFLEI
jgi:hypothetical protein